MSNLFLKARVRLPPPLVNVFKSLGKMLNSLGPIKLKLWYLSLLMLAGTVVGISGTTAVNPFLSDVLKLTPGLGTKLFKILNI